jgi:hypothetical protein
MGFLWPVEWLDKIFHMQTKVQPFQHEIDLRTYYMVRKGSMGHVYTKS